MTGPSEPAARWVLRLDVHGWYRFGLLAGRTELLTSQAYEEKAAAERDMGIAIQQIPGALVVDLTEDRS